MSNRRLAANRSNSRLSTGPTTSSGKDASSQNAIRHGLFSSRLLLPDEDAAEFHSMHEDLRLALRPADAIENALVDRIAVTLWRQRRLVGSESAAIALSRQKNRVSRAVSEELDLNYGSRLKPEDLEPPDTVQVDWCKTALAEIENIESDDVELLKAQAPLTYAQLEDDAVGEDVPSYLADYKGGLFAYLSELAFWCRQQLRDAERRPQLMNLADLVTKQRMVLEPNQLELLTRYQTMLDNQLYKALRALREAQDWRLKTLEASSVEPDSAGNAE